MAKCSRRKLTTPVMSYSETVNGKALLLSHEGRPGEAVAVLRGGLPELADDLETLNNLAWILVNESIDPQEGYRHARAAAELGPDDPAILDTLGWAAIRSRRPHEAIAPLTKALELTGDAEVRLHLGIALAESGRREEGVAHVRAALRERPLLAEVPEAARWRVPWDLLPWIASAATPHLSRCAATRLARCLVRVNTITRDSAGSFRILTSKSRLPAAPT